MGDYTTRYKGHTIAVTEEWNLEEAPYLTHSVTIEGPKVNYTFKEKYSPTCKALDYIDHPHTIPQENPSAVLQ